MYSAFSPSYTDEKRLPAFLMSRLRKARLSRAPGLKLSDGNIGWAQAQHTAPAGELPSFCAKAYALYRRS
jgi:hypothetical protein